MNWLWVPDVSLGNLGRLSIWPIVYWLGGWYLLVLYVLLCVYATYNAAELFFGHDHDEVACGCKGNRDDAHPWKFATPECSICMQRYGDHPVGTYLGVSVHCRHVFHSRCLFDVIYHGGWIAVTGPTGSPLVILPPHADANNSPPRPKCPICRRELFGLYVFGITFDHSREKKWTRENGRLVRF